MTKSPKAPKSAELADRPSRSRAKSAGPVSFQEPRVQNRYPKLLELSMFRPMQGATAADIPVLADLLVSKVSKTYAGRQYLFGFRAVTLKIDLKNIALKPSPPRYRFPIGPSAFAEKLKIDTQKDEADSSGIGAEVGADLAKMSFIARLKAHFSRRRDAGKHQKTSISATLTGRVIRPIPTLSWVIGDADQGDIRHPDGVLYGTYFDEQRSGEEPAPLFKGQRTSDEQMCVEARVYAKYDDIVVRPVDVARCSEREARVKSKIVELLLTKEGKRMAASRSPLADGVLMSVGTMEGN